MVYDEDFNNWNFRASGAVLDLNIASLSIDGIPELQVADAYIIPKKGNIIVSEEFNISPLNHAEIILDTINEYHKFTNSDILIKSSLGSLIYSLFKSVKKSSRALVRSLGSFS